MDTDKKILIKLCSILASLIVIMGISLLLKKGDGKAMSVNTALVNPKYYDDINEIHISIPETQNKDTDFTGTVEESGMLVLKKNGKIWTGEINAGTDKIIWPADSSTVENLIRYCTDVRKLYEKSSSVKNHESLSVTEETAKSIEVYTKDGKSVSKILFGKENPLTSRISIRSASRMQVYEMENDISLYLNVKSSFYADPYLFPLCVTYFSEEEKSSLLRHGIINDSLKEKRECLKSDPVNILRKDFADGSGIKFKFYRTADQKENTYTVIPEFTPSITASLEEKNAVNRFNYTYSISSWTYDRLFSE